MFLTSGILFASLGLAWFALARFDPRDRRVTLYRVFAGITLLVGGAGRYFGVEGAALVPMAAAFAIATYFLLAASIEHGHLRWTSGRRNGL